MPREARSLPDRSYRSLAWRDVTLVVGMTVMSIAVASHFELNEALFALTRHGEYLQLDELPIGMLVLTLGLIWLSWKRNADANRELQARYAAEAALAGVVDENRNLARENLRIQEFERKRLARELHDELGQYLNAIKLDATSIVDTGGTDPALASDGARAVIRSVDHVYVAVREMIGRLRPAGLDELGLVAAIEHGVDHWRERNPATRIQLSVRGDCDQVGETQSLAVFRLIQEGLANVHKHAGAQCVTIELVRTGRPPGGRDELRLTIADDGCGMDPASRHVGYGICGMRERVELAGGTFILNAAPGRGVRFEINLPVEEVSP
jgi:signal transduction histidine kinase